MSSSDLSERSDDNDEDDDGTGSEDNNCDGNGNCDGRGDRNTGAGGGSVEWMRFLSPSALAEALGAMAKAKASLSKKLKKTKVGKK